MLVFPAAHFHQSPYLMHVNGTKNLAAPPMSFHPRNDANGNWHLPAYGGKRPTKFEPCTLGGSTCSLERTKTGANYVHAHCTYDPNRSLAIHTVAWRPHIGVSVYGVWCNWLKIFPVSEDPTHVKVYPLARAPPTAQHWWQQWHVPIHSGYRITKFEPCVFSHLALGLERVKRGANYVHAPGMCNVQPTSVIWHKALKKLRGPNYVQAPCTCKVNPTSAVHTSPW